MISIVIVKVSKITFSIISPSRAGWKRQVDNYCSFLECTEMNDMVRNSDGKTALNCAVST